MRKEIILSDRVKPCGNVKDLKNIYCLGEYDPATDYFIEISTVEQMIEQADTKEAVEVAEQHANDPDKEKQAGKMKLPVKSVGKIGRKYYFATDGRFVNYPGAERVFPEGRLCTMQIQQDGKGFKGSLFFQGTPLITSRFRRNKNEVLQELAAWALDNGDRFDFTAEINRMAKALSELPGMELKDDE